MEYSKNILENPKIKGWIIYDKYFQDIHINSRKGSKLNKEKTRITEKNWGNNMIKEYCGYSKITKQWTTILSEFIVKKILEKKGFIVNKPKKINNFKPDWETEECIYEVKSRTYSTSGTAGEKILGVPFKYASIPRLYNKPLKIVLVGFQEQEAISKFNIFSPTKEKKIMIDFWKNNFNIEFIKASDLFKS